MTSSLPRSTELSEVSMNRNSLEPEPDEQPSDACFHRDVCAGGARDTFSAQRGHPVFPARLPGRSVNMSVGALSPGGQTTRHRHAYEALTYILEGQGHTWIEGTRFDWQSGDALYIPPWCWHQHVASPGGAVRYLTATNQPLLSALGSRAIRQEQT